MFPDPGTMERPQTCDNPDGHRMEEGEGIKDQIFQKHDGMLSYRSCFLFQRQWFLAKYLKDIARRYELWCEGRD